MSIDLMYSPWRDRHKDLLNLIDKAESLLNTLNQNTSIIKSVFGEKSNEYLNISNEIVQTSMACLVHPYNRFNELMTFYTPIEYQKYFLWEQKRIERLFEKIGTLEMDYETRKRYENNIKVLKGNYEDNGNSSEDSHWLLQENGMADKVNDVVTGCYIATMVYGDYNHPQVLVLRDFRDSFLAHFHLGQTFIKFYYKHSPGWVKALENKKTLNKIIKGILNIIINFIR